jgi:para-nitrobenzyl esterase
MRNPALRPFASLALLAAAACLACAGDEAPARPDPATRRSPPAGDVVGFTGAYGSHVWLGLPFAQPPVDALRWRAPLPVARWQGEREALAFAPLCPQYASRFGGDDSESEGTPVGQEDCLYLNVYAPSRARPGAGLPVMVWIHGGGNVVGTARLYDGGRLAQEQDVVVVTIQYRLGPLGWFRHAALRAEGGSAQDRSGNYGNLDQVRALAWVRENIAAFGGAPDNVTIFGESAGGRDVFALLISPLARGLFHRAVVQSGSTRTLPAHQAENFADDPPPGHRNSSGEILLRLLEDDGARGRGEARTRLASMSAAEVATYLRGKKPRELLEPYRRDRAEGLIEVPQQFRDGVVLPEGDPLSQLQRGRGSVGVPVIFGTNRDEDRLFLFANPARVRWILGLVPSLRDAPNYLATARHMSDMWQVVGVDEPAARLRKLQPDVFAYRFDWDEEPELLWMADLSQMLGAAHGFEIPFVFGHWDLGREARVLFSRSNEPGREELSAKMRSYWAQFAWSGAPGQGRSGDLPAWQAWSPRPDGEKRLVLDTQAGGGVRMAPGALSRAQVIAAVDTDPRLPDQRAKCGVFRELALHERGVSPDRYETVGEAGCSAYPLDAHPWDE